MVQGHLEGLLEVKGNMVQDLVGDLQNIQCLSAKSLVTINHIVGLHKEGILRRGLVHQTS